MESRDYVLHLAAASEAAHAALDAVDSQGEPPDARALAHAVDPLLWAVGALLNRVADHESTDANAAEVFSRSSTQVTRALDDLLNEVGHPGQQRG